MELVSLYKCLADNTRLQILNLLRDGPLCGCHFMEVLGLPQVKVSKQLNYMHSLGVLAKEREANWMIYSLSEPVHPVLAKNLPLGSRLRQCATMVEGKKEGKRGEVRRYDM